MVDLSEELLALMMLPRCKCGAMLDLVSKCPAICEPLPLPRPPYIGPLVVGKTHMSKLSQPVLLSHEWMKSSLGHGVLMCRNCFVTILEANAINSLYCDKA